MADLERQIKISVDGEGVETGVENAKASLRGLGDAARKAGTDAGQGLSGIGPAVEQSSRKVEATTKNLVGAIERTTAAMEAGQRGTRAYYEALANQRGVDVNALKPYLDQLDAVTAKQKAAAATLDATNAPLERVGMSAKATAAALRGVPAQFTDIVVSLQGGQQPLTVFLQQGGQLKDMFGGAGAAAKALGGYIAGLINPFTVAAAAIGAVGLAWMQGAKEADAYGRALILSGNAVGATVGQLQEMARAMSAIGGTQGKAAEALAAIAASGSVARENLQEFAGVAIRMEREVGQPIEKTVEAFKELAEHPLKATLKLNEGLNYLTTSTYEQIRALERQGKEEEAAEAAQKAYASAMEKRTSQLEANLGTIERAARSVIGAAKGMWDALLGVGREQTAQTRLDDINKRIAQLQNEQASGGFASNAGGAAFGRPNNSLNAAREKELQTLQAQAAALGGVIYQKREEAKADAERAKTVKDLAGFHAEEDKFATNATKRTRELAEVKGKYLGLVKEGLITQQQYDKLRADVAEKYKDKKGSSSGTETAGESEIARIKALIDQEKLYAKALEQSGAQAQKLTEGEKLALQIRQQLQEKSMTDSERANKQRALGYAEELAALQKSNRAAKEHADAIAESQKEYDKLIAGTNKAADSIEEQARKQEAANGVFGKGKAAIEEMTLAQLKNQMAEAQASDRFTPEYIAALQRKIDAQTRYTESLHGGDAKAEQARIDEWTRSIQEQAKLYEDEAALAGKTQLERAKILALRKVQLDVEKQLADINKQSYGEDVKEAQRQQVRDAGRLAGETAVRKVVEDDWQKTSDQINQSLTDALLRGFESGKDFATNLRDTVVNMFKTMVLRPVIQAVMAPVSGAIAGVLGGGGSGGGVLGMASNAQSAYSLYQKAPQYWNQFTNWLGGGATYAGASGALAGGAGSGLLTTGGTVVNTGLGYGAGGFGSSGAFGGAAAEGFGYGAGSAATFGTGAAGAAAGYGGSAAVVGAGAEGAVAAGAAGSAGASGAVAGLSATGWGVIAAAAILAVMYFSKSGGGPKTEAGAGFGIPDPMKRGNIEDAEKIGKGISDSYASLATQLGITNQKLDVGVFYAKDPKGDSPTQLQVVAGLDGQEVYRRARKGTNDEFDPTFENVGRTDEELQKAVADATTRAIYAALKESDLGGKYKDWLKAQEDATKPARDAQAQAGGIDMNALRQQFGEFAEQIADNMRAAGKSNMPGGVTAEEDPAVLNARIKYITQLKEFDDAINQLPFEYLKNMSIETTEGLWKVAGGIQSLGQKLSGYYENYYSDAEKTAITTKNVADSLKKLGLEMPGTRDQFRKLVEDASTHLDTEEGRKTYNALLDLQAAFASITPAAGAAAGTAGALKDALKGLPFDSLRKLTNEAASALADFSGGMDALKGNLSSYYQNYYSDAERAAFATQQLTAEFAAIGLQMPQSRDELRKLIDLAMEPARLATEGGEAFLATLLKLADAFKDVTPAGNAAAGAVAAAPTGWQATNPDGTVNVNQADAGLAEMQRQYQAQEAANKWGALLLSLPFDHLANVTDTARESLLTMAGGIDALTGKLNSFSQNFYSDAERTAKQTENLAAQFAALGIAMPQTREEFRKLVEDAAAQLAAVPAKMTLAANNDYWAAIDGGTLPDLYARNAAAAQNNQAADAAAAAATGQYNALLNLADAFAAVVPATASASVSAQAWAEALQGLPFDELRTMSEAARDALIKAAGGLDKLTASLQGFYANYYSDAERAAIGAQQLGAEFEALGLKMPATREQFRALVEGAAKDTSDAGLAFYAALLQLQGKFADLVPAAAAAVQAAADVQAGWRAMNADGSYNVNQADIAQAAADRAKALRDAEFAQLDAAMNVVEKSVAAQRKTLDAQRQAASEIISNVGGIFDTLKSNVAELYAQGDNGAQAAREGRAFIEQALSNAQATGYLPEREELNQAIAAAKKGLDAANFGSREDMDRQRLILAGQLDSLREIAGAQLDPAQAQLKAAEDQIKALDDLLETARAQVDAAKGIDASVLSVAEAVDRLHATIAGIGQAQQQREQEQQREQAGQLPPGVTLGRDFWGLDDPRWNQPATPQDGPMIPGYQDWLDAQERARQAMFAPVAAEAPQPPASSARTLDASPPPAWNAVNAATLRTTSALEALLAEVQQLRQDNSAENRAIASSTGNTARLLDRAMPEGDAIQMRATA